MAGTSLDYEGLSIALGLTSCKVTKDVPTSAIRPTLIKAWSNLRHGAAHAAAFDINYAKPEQTQKLPVGIDKVTTLMYEHIPFDWLRGRVHRLLGARLATTETQDWDGLRG